MTPEQAEERVRQDAADRMQHTTTSDLSARLMCRVGFRELTLLLAHYDGLKRAHAASLAPAVPEGWEREARQHIVELEQCSLFVDSAPLAKAMTNAADFLRKLATSDARPLPTEGDAGRAALEAEKTGGEP